MESIYLDYNATTPHDPEVLAVMRPFLEEHFGNPSSGHWYGIRAKNALENARRQIASLLGCEPCEIVFTSGGTESNNYAIRGIALARQSMGNHIITSQIEHPAVIEVCTFLEEDGFEVSYLPVDEFGIVSVSNVERAITSQTILITIMHANNEVGSIQPIEHISKLARERGIVMHTDAAQSASKIPADVNLLGVDLLSIAGHKLYAPKGIGALYIRRGVELTKLIHGADHEQGKRAGTENILGIVGLGKACEIAKRDLQQNTTHMRRMRGELYGGLKGIMEDVKRNGHPKKRLPNTLSLSFPGLDANRLLSKIKEGVAASAGAACHSEEDQVSPVLKAMSIPIQQARGTLRFSTGRMTTHKEIESAVDIVSNAVLKIREEA